MAFSEDFLKKYAKIAQQNQQAAMIAGAGDSLSELKLKKKRGGAHTGTKMSHWNYTMPNDVNVIVYDPHTGMAFPSPSHARAYGLSRFVYNLPPGMKVNWSQWDKYAQPETPETPVAETTVADQTLPFTPEPASPNVYPTAQPQPEPEPQPQPQPPPPPPPPPPVVASVAKKKRKPPPPPPPPPAIVTKAQWDEQATYLQGPGHSGPMAGKNIKANEGPNLDRYYAGYVADMKKKNAAGHFAHANEINRAHGLDPSKKAAPVKKQTGPKVGSLEWRDLHGLTQ